MFNAEVWESEGSIGNHPIIRVKSGALKNVGRKHFGGAKLIKNGGGTRNFLWGGRASERVVGGKGGEKMAGVWFGQRTTFGLGNRNGSSVAGIEGKRCPTLTEGLAKK